VAKGPSVERRKFGGFISRDACRNEKDGPKAAPSRSPAPLLTVFPTRTNFPLCDLFSRSNRQRFAIVGNVPPSTWPDDPLDPDLSEAGRERAKSGSTQTPTRGDAKKASSLAWKSSSRAIQNPPAHNAYATTPQPANPVRHAAIYDARIPTTDPACSSPGRGTHLP
jgi:hypothetical protein